MFQLPFPHALCSFCEASVQGDDSILTLTAQEWRAIDDDRIATSPELVQTVTACDLCSTAIRDGLIRVLESARAK